VADTSFFQSNLFTWVILPLLIFFARICDVSIGTLRILLLSKGNRILAPLLSFFEVLIWLIAISQIMKNLSNFVCYFAYAGGFATGTYVGMYIEGKLAMGIMLIRIITRKDATQLIEYLKSAGYGITSVDAQGITGLVHIIFTIVERKNLRDVIGKIKRFNPKAFYSIEDVRFVSNGTIRPLEKKNYLKFFKGHRK